MCSSRLAHYALSTPFTPSLRCCCGKKQQRTAEKKFIIIIDDDEPKKNTKNLIKIVCKVEISWQRGHQVEKLNS